MVRPGSVDTYKSMSPSGRVASVSGSSANTPRRGMDRVDGRNVTKAALVKPEVLVRA